MKIEDVQLTLNRLNDDIRRNFPNDVMASQEYLLRLDTDGENHLIIWLGMVIYDSSQQEGPVTEDPMELETELRLTVVSVRDDIAGLRLVPVEDTPPASNVQN
jgi:hypothetical protein